MITVLLLLFIFRQYGSSAAPVITPDSHGHNPIVLSRSESSDACSLRSVWDVAWSCLATTFAVTWVSVHANVPLLEEGKWAILRRRLFLMVLSLLAPEVMIMWAFKQWRGALKIRESINHAQIGSSTPKWTMKHAHFLQMGGFKLVCTKKEAASRIKDERGISWKVLGYNYGYHSRLGDDIREGFMRFRIFRALVRDQMIDFPLTTEQEIDDRSKGDALSKGIALLQITWFIVQLLARRAQGLTITEVELTTAALAGMNSAVYLFLWNKPLDVRCPIVIRTKEVEKILLERPLETHKWEFQDPLKFRLRDYLRASAYAFTHRVSVFINRPRNALQRAWKMLLHPKTYLVGPSARAALTSEEGAIAADGEQGKTDLKHPEQITNVHEVKIDKMSCNNRETNPNKRSKLISLPKRMLVILRDILQAILRLPYVIMFMPMDRILLPGSRRFKMEQYKDVRDKVHRKSWLAFVLDEGDIDWIMSLMFYCEDADIKPLLFASAAAGAAFGSIHCVAWNFDFSSLAEKFLWRSMSLALVGVCLSILVGSFLHTVFVYRYYMASRGSRLRSFWLNLRMLLMVASKVPCAVYPVARISLLVLAILSLRDLPDSALETVTWTKFIPHI